MGRKTAHEQGYRDFVRLGVGARNPYAPGEKGNLAWARGWQKARDHYAKFDPRPTQEGA